jgi:hypothetical protein
MTINSCRQAHTIYEYMMESRLCQRCSVLSLDDMAYDGTEFQDAYGKWLLGFHSTGRGLYRELPLDYNLSDRLPDLSCLRASAEAGCAFCEALRDAALMLDLNTSGTVTFELCYLWFNGSKEHAGLKYLVVRLEIETEGGTKKDHQGSLLFHVDCEPGEISQWNKSVGKSLKCQC